MQEVVSRHSGPRLRAPLTSIPRINMNLKRAAWRVDQCSCDQRNSRRSMSAKLVPIVERITEFTDGDETDHVRSALIEAVARISPVRLPDLYEHHVVEDGGADTALGRSRFPGRDAFGCRTLRPTLKSGRSAALLWSFRTPSRVKQIGLTYFRAKLVRDISLASPTSGTEWPSGLASKASHSTASAIGSRVRQLN